MRIAKTFIICIVIYFYGFLGDIIAQDIKIVDFAVEGPDESNIVDLFDEVTFKFLMKNCSDHTIDELQISATAGEWNEITQHPARLIKNLGPEKTHAIQVELISGIHAQKFEVFLKIKIGESRYFAHERVFFNIEHRPELDYNNIDCENPRVHLHDFGYPKLTNMNFWFDNTLHANHIKIPSVQQSRQRYRRTGYLLGAAGLAAADMGTYFHFQADNLYKNDYQTATADAAQIQKDILNYEQQSHYLLGAAFPLFALSTYNAIKQIRLNRQLNLLLSPTSNNGAVVSLNYAF